MLNANNTWIPIPTPTNRHDIFLRFDEKNQAIPINTAIPKMPRSNEARLKFVSRESVVETEMLFCENNINGARVISTVNNSFNFLISYC